MGCLIALLIIGGIVCLFLGFVGSHLLWPLALILWALAFIVGKVGKNKE